MLKLQCYTMHFVDVIDVLFIFQVSYEVVDDLMLVDTGFLKLWPSIT